MRKIDSDSIGNAAPFSKWVEAMEAAFRDVSSGKLYVPRRLHIDREENTLLLMPCFSDRYFCTKLVSVFPENSQINKPVIYGTVILNDGTTGEPLAVMDGSKLTAMRTAAVGSVGIKYLAPADSDKLGIIGLGIQGFHQALFACRQRPIKELRVFDRSASIMSRFKERFKALNHHVDVIPCKTAAELCEASEIIITATGSNKPVIPESNKCWMGKTMIGIGSYKPDMREFPDGLFQHLDIIYVDTLDGLSEAGDLLDPLQAGMIMESNFIPVSNLLNGKSSPQGNTQLFKSVGMAAFDLYGAQLVYESASTIKE